MTRWTARPVEIAYLLNPAFSGLLVHEAVREYNRIAGVGMPVPLLFLVVPVALHKRTREVLPGSTAANMHAWLESHPQVRIGFARRVIAMKAPVREGLLYAGSRQLVGFDRGELIPKRKTAIATPSSWQREHETYAVWRAAGFVGRWVASAATTATLFALWGIKP